ncbi:MAG: HD domain-containing protein [Clostridia bacterium]|nr:HD domain-containing protein [Clostridia bacterium]MBR5942747.1 HD domain-containing protein [Clostridia bacterium]
MTEKKQKNKNAWRNILISALVVVFFVGVLITYYSMLYSETKQKIIKNGELSSVTSAEQINKYLSKGIDTIKLVCYTLDSMIRSGKSQEEIKDFLINQSSALVNTTSENSTGIYGYIRGEYLDGTEWVPDDDYVPTERPWYTGARASVGRVAVVDPYVDAQTNTVLITFSKTLCDGKSVAAMDFSMDSMQTITEQIAEEGELETEIVLDQKYQVIAHSDKSEVGKNYFTENDTFGSALVNKLRASEGDNYFSFEYDGKDYVVYAVSVSNDWTCISIYNATSVFSQLRQTVIFTIAISLSVVLILLLILFRSNRKQEEFTHMRQVVEALAAAIDAKDAYTNGHSGRVADYAVEISRRYGYSKKKQNELHMIGLLHDVGKIGIPDSVINKPGKLTPEEYDIIKTHSEIGAQMLSRSSEMRKLSDGVRWHHERYDGRGYPDGLVGENIYEEARIIAVADAYDAMTSERSYRTALPQDVVRSEIEKGKGAQFDPVFADIMLKMIDEDKEYRMHA